jgi:hypothetical protein
MSRRHYEFWPQPKKLVKMPRKPKATVDIMGDLEVMSRDTSLPEAVRSEAAKEYVRLKAAMSPAPSPAPAATPYTEAEIKEAFSKIGVGVVAKPTAPDRTANPESETQEFAKEHRGPEPVEGEESKPKPYVWRDERGRTTEMIKADMFREKQANSRAWAESMGLTTTRPEWPGV